VYPQFTIITADIIGSCSCSQWRCFLCTYCSSCEY